VLALDLVSVVRKMTRSKSTPLILSLEKYNPIDSKEEEEEFQGI